MKHVNHGSDIFHICVKGEIDNNTDTLGCPQHRGLVLNIFPLLSSVDISAKGSEVSGHVEKPKHS